MPIQGRVDTSLVIIVRKTLWGSWALACAFSAVGGVVAAWSLPGPPVAPIAVAISVVLALVASRLFVSVDAEELTVPRGLGRARIQRGEMADLSIKKSGVGTGATYVIVVPMVDGSQRRVSALTSFGGLPGGQASLRSAAELISTELGLSG